MTTRDSAATEVSVPAGAGLLVVGLGTWAAQFFLGIFAGWEAAIPVGGLWVAFGTLLFFPDVRLYRRGQSPLEELLVRPRSDGERVDSVEA